MNLQGERVIPATVERTWAALNDPQTLKACIAGCESIETTGDNQYLATMAVRIGPVNAKFKGRLQLTDIVPLSSYTINFDGQGGVAGFGKGSADVALTPVDDGAATRLVYRATAQVGGKIAQIGSRLVESAAAKIADDFFSAFEKAMTTPVPATGDPGAASPGVDTAAAGLSSAPALAPAPAPSPAPTTGAPSPAGGAGKPWFWAAAAALAVVVAYALTR